MSLVEVVQPATGLPWTTTVAPRHVRTGIVSRTIGRRPRRPTYPVLWDPSEALMRGYAYPMAEQSRQAPRSRADYERGLPDYHDPTAGLGGAPPAQSALTLRLILAVFGLIVCVAGGVALLLFHVPAFLPVLLFVLAMVALIDMVVIVRRKARGEPG
jgi:hypothetical protein